jgi:hypothetical protein
MEHASIGLRNIMGDLLRRHPPEEAPVMAWPVVCGRDVSARTRALAFADGRLTVEVPDPAWRAQLAAFIPRYLSGLKDLIGPVVSEIRFVKPSAFSIQHSTKPQR